MSEWAIDLSGVKKTFRGGVRALGGVDLRVARGEIFGLLGPNGAGKSTLVKIMMTVIRKSSGRGTVLGRPLADKPTLRRVGYLPEHHRFPGYLTGRQVLGFVGGLHGMEPSVRKRRAAELLDVVDMTAWAKTPVKKYSKGMRQRLGIAQALINDPELVVLDEPTDGVDPVGRREIRDLCKRMAGEGRTVFLNSHLLSELEMVCGRVAIMVRGGVRSQGTIDEMVEGQERYELTVAAEPSQARALLLASLPAGSTPPGEGVRGALPSGSWLECEGGVLRIGTADPAEVAPVIDGLRSRGALLRSVEPHRPSLEDLFMQAVIDPETGRELAPGAARGRAAKAASRGAKAKNGGAA